MPDPENRSFDPSTEETNRVREQGGGLGQRELDSQRDPARTNASEALAGEAAQADDVGGPTEGLQQGRTNTNREYEDESDDLQGPKTLEANRDRVRGDPDMNP